MVLSRFVRVFEHEKWESNCLEEEKNHSLETGMLLVMLLLEAAKACDLVTLLVDDGVSIETDSRSPNTES